MSTDAANLVPRRRLRGYYLRSNSGVPRDIIDRDLRSQDGCAEPVAWYLVCWQHAPGATPYQDSWEPGDVLREDGFAQACDLVDRWKAANSPSFDAFARADELRNAVGASPDGRCAFQALKQALRFLDNEAWMVDGMVDRFHDICAGEGRPLGRAGITTGVAQRFINFGNANRPSVAKPLSVPIFKRNLLPGSIHGEDALAAIPLPDGVFICAAFNRARCGHAFVILVRDNWTRVIDGDDYHAGILGFGSWIHGVYFLREIALYNPK